ncbi:MAG: transglutaminase-like domain-containing protein [Cyanobacteriota bacterium]
MKKLTLDDLKNIINIIKDPDEKIFEMLEDKLLSEGYEFLYYIKNEYNTTNNDILRSRLWKLIEKLRFNNSQDIFRKIPLLDDQDINLEEACFILVNFVYPDIEISKYKDKLDEMSDNLRDKIKNLEDPLMIIKKINQYLFLAEGFKGNKADYFNAENSFINKVLDNKTGIPITLSIIYLLITKRLDLPFYGVGMPGHFIIKYYKDDLEIFLDPFHGGKILSKTDCINFLVFSGYGFTDRFLEKSSNKEIFKRMIRNILLVYQEVNDNYRYEKLTDILNIIDMNY